MLRGSDPKSLSAMAHVCDAGHFLLRSIGGGGISRRAITLIVSYPPGGVTDLGARAFAEAMEKHLKQPVVVMNKPGGATTIGGNAVVTAKPDGIRSASSLL